MKVFKAWFSEFQPDGRTYECRPGDPVPPELVERLMVEQPGIIEDRPDPAPVEEKVTAPERDKMLRGSDKRK